MSEFYQPGQHPDADQLSAFAEDALPAHEREQTLAHLAGCADCRMIVSLALPPMEDVPQVQPAAERRPWFYGWNVAWLAGAGLAALIILTVHIRNSGRDVKMVAMPTQTAEVSPQAAPAMPAVTSATPSPALKTPRAAASPQAADSVEGLKTPAKGATIDGREIANLPIEGRRFIALPSQQQMTQQQMQQQQSAALHGSVGGPIAGAAAGNGLARNDRPLFAQRSANSAVDTDSNAASTIVQPLAPAAAAPVMGAPLQQAATPAAAPKPTAQTNSTVEVSSAAAAIETTDASVSTSLASISPINIRRLPSHLAIASTITHANQMLALDTAGALFLSTDDGHHWKAVAAPWRGRAVKVELASLPMAPTKQPTNNFTIDGNASGTTLSGDNLKAVTIPSVLGVVTDPSGAIIPGVSIRVTNTRTGIVRATTSDRKGRYAVDGLAPDAYQIDASAPGFQAQRSTVTLAATQQSVVNIQLTVGAVSESVDVAAEAPMLTDRTERKALKKAEKAAPLSGPPVFEITTDSGEIWTSIDGKNWKSK